MWPNTCHRRGYHSRTVGRWRSGAHVAPSGLAAFSSHREYPTPTGFSVRDSDQRMHLSVWLRDGVDIDADGWKFRVNGLDTVAGYLPGTPWCTGFSGRAHHVGLLLPPNLLRTLAGERGERFFEQLRRAGFLRVTPAHAALLRAAHELDAVLLASDTSPLLREAKSLELLARLTDADPQPAKLTRGQRTRLDEARAILLHDLARSPSIAELARRAGMNTFRLKQGFKQHFGLPVYALYQQQRMRVAWDLIATGQMSVTEAGHHLGYTNMSHFSSAFRKAHGLLPREVKRRSR